MIGDIALTTSDGLVGRKIRFATSSPVSHAMLYVTQSSIVHAVREGVHAENTQGIFSEENAPVYVMRLKGGLPPIDAEKICDHVRSNVGTQYTIREAALTALGGNSEASAKQFCSRLVAQAYAAAGYHLVGAPDYCAPDDILKSDLLENVQGCTEPVANSEVQFWQSGDMSPVDHTMELLNIVLKQIRKIDSTVQSFQNIGPFLIKHPEHDAAVNEMLTASGFLAAWQHDIDEHPWRYDMGSIGKMTGIKSYCTSTMRGEPRDNNRFTKSLDGLKVDHFHHSRVTFASLISLYERLVEQHAKRFDAAAFWLSIN